MLFFAGFLASTHIKAIESGDQVEMINLAVAVCIACFAAIACYKSKTTHSEAQWDKVIDQFVKSWERLSCRLSSGRWILTIVSAVAFGVFCHTTAKILLAMATKLPDTTVVALFMFLANIVQNVFKDFFHAHSDTSPEPEENLNNGNGKPVVPPIPPTVTP